MERGPFTLPRPGVGNSDSRFHWMTGEAAATDLSYTPVSDSGVMELFFSPTSKSEHHEDRGPATARLIPRLFPAQLFLSRAKEDISHPELLRPSSKKKKKKKNAGRHQRAGIKCRLSEFTPRKT